MFSNTTRNIKTIYYIYPSLMLAENHLSTCSLKPQVSAISIPLKKSTYFVRINSNYIAYFCCKHMVCNLLQVTR